MTFLASLTSGAAVLVRAAATEWQSDVAREVTIQIRPAPAVTWRLTSPGPPPSRAPSRGSPTCGHLPRRSRAPAQPSLGTGLRLDDLPVPRIIVGPHRAAQPARSRAIARRARPPGSGPSLDDHRAFVDRMRAMAAAAVLAAITVLALVLTGHYPLGRRLDQRRNGHQPYRYRGAATDRRQGQLHRRPFSASLPQLGLKGGAAGGGATILLFVQPNLLQRPAFRARAMVTSALPCSARFRSGLWGYVAESVAQVLLIAVVTAATSRYTVNPRRSRASVDGRVLPPRRGSALCPPRVGAVDVDGRIEVR